MTSGDPTPLEAFLAAIAHHTTLPAADADESAADDSDAADPWTDSVSEADSFSTHPRYVEHRFAGFVRFAALGSAAVDAPSGPTSLTVYLEQLRFVRDGLRVLEEDDGAAGLHEKIEEARGTIRGLIDSQEVGWRADFERLLWPVVEGASENSALALGMGAGRNWCAEIYRPWMETLAGRYPFDPDGPDAAIDEVRSFFHPELGRLWSLYEEVLSGAFPREGQAFRRTRHRGQRWAAVYRPSLPRYLERAHEFTRTFFPAGSSDPAIDFDVRIRPSPHVATIDLVVDEQRVSHENGPERWARLHWPSGEARVRGAVVRARGMDGMRETIRHDGVWGLFRLLRTAQVVESDRETLTVSWPMHGLEGGIAIDIRPVRSARPFVAVPERIAAPRTVSPLRGPIEPPREIVAQQTTCGR